MTLDDFWHCADCGARPNSHIQWMGLIVAIIERFKE